MQAAHVRFCEDPPDFVIFAFTATLRTDYVFKLNVMFAALGTGVGPGACWVGILLLSYMPSPFKISSQLSTRDMNSQGTLNLKSFLKLPSSWVNRLCPRLVNGSQPMGHPPPQNNLLTEAAYQISYISDVYITIHNHSKITAMKLILWLGSPQHEEL